MNILTFILRIITMLWMFLIPLGFALGMRKNDKIGRRLLSGLGWAWVMWLLSAAAWGALFWIDEQPSGWLTDTSVSTAFLISGIVLGSIWSIRQIVLMLHQRRMQNISEALAWLKDMPADDFELLVGRYFKSLGCVVRHIGKSGDHGVDLAAYSRSEGKWIIQCKRYKNKMIGEAAVRDLYGAMMHEHADRGYLFTTSHFSQPALNWAEEKPIELIAGEELVARLNANNVRYIDKGIVVPQEFPRDS